MDASGWKGRARTELGQELGSSEGPLKQEEHLGLTQGQSLGG